VVVASKIVYPKETVTYLRKNRQCRDRGSNPRPRVRHPSHYTTLLLLSQSTHELPYSAITVSSRKCTINCYEQCMARQQSNKSTEYLIIIMQCSLKIFLFEVSVASSSQLCCSLRRFAISDRHFVLKVLRKPPPVTRDITNNSLITDIVKNLVRKFLSEQHTTDCTHNYFTL